MKRLWTWFVELDRILRGEKTRVSDLREGEIDLPLGGIALVLAILGVFYGICMGCYAVVNHGRAMQMLASAVKVPALFLLTLAVTLPSLYVFNAIVGSRLTILSLVRLFVAALGVNLAVLASLGPIAAFFSVNTTSYAFMVLLNVLIFAVSGVLGMGFLLQTLHRLNVAPRWRMPPENSGMASGSPNDPASGENADENSVIQAVRADEPGPLSPLEGHVLGRHVKTVFGWWMILFGIVGAQMSWVLRPFIGSPGMEFQWFRPRTSNFFEAVWKALTALFG